jgi:hypothetical protein
MTSACAADPHHAENKPSATSVSSPSPAMMDNMKKMKLQMAQLRATTDHKERERLLGEHMKTMQDTMSAMRGSGGMMGCEMMSSGKMGEGKMGMQHDKSTDGMGMMQMMMDQMMEHQKAMQSPPK